MHCGTINVVPPVLDPDAALARLAASARGERRLLGIAGPPGAGKSTLAQAVVDAVEGAVLVPMDGFHLAQSVIDAAGLADRKGAPETFDRAGYAALLTRLRHQRLGAGARLRPGVPSHDRRTHRGGYRGAA